LKKSIPLQKKKLSFLFFVVAINDLFYIDINTRLKINLRFY